MKRVVLIASLLLLAAAPVLAAPAVGREPTSAASAAKPEVNYYGDWAVRCFPIKSISPCDMLFATVNKQSGVRVTSVSIAYAPSRDAYLMQVVVPLGIALQQGVVITAGNYTTAKLAVRRCDRGGCYVEMPIGKDVVDGLMQSDGGAGSLKIVADGGKPLSLTMSLKGFSAAHQAMVNDARQKANGTGPAPAEQ